MSGGLLLNKSLLRNRLHVIINTHGRPLQAVATLMTLKAQESGYHDVDYTLCWDKEDLASNKLQFMGLPCVCNVEPRPDSVADVWNRNLVPGYDYSLCLPDDAFCATFQWDKYIVESMSEKGSLLLGWNDLANPDQFTLPIISAKYLAALDQPFFDPQFPCWFADTAAAETHSFVAGQFTRVGTYLIMAGPIVPRKVPVEAWHPFIASRQARFDHAARIRERLDLPTPARTVTTALWAQFEARDTRGMSNGHRPTD